MKYFKHEALANLQGLHIYACAVPCASCQRDQSQPGERQSISYVGMSFCEFDSNYVFCCMYIVISRVLWVLLLITIIRQAHGVFKNCRPNIALSLAYQNTNMTNILYQTYCPVIRTKYTKVVRGERILGNLDDGIRTKAEVSNSESSCIRFFVCRLLAILQQTDSGYCRVESLR